MCTLAQPCPTQPPSQPRCSQIPILRQNARCVEIPPMLTGVASFALSKDGMQCHSPQCAASPPAGGRVWCAFWSGQNTDWQGVLRQSHWGPVAGGRAMPRCSPASPRAAKFFPLFNAPDRTCHLPTSMRPTGAHPVAGSQFLWSGKKSFPAAGESCLGRLPHTARFHTKCHPIVCPRTKNNQSHKKGGSANERPYHLLPRTSSCRPENRTGRSSGWSGLSPTRRGQRCPSAGPVGPPPQHHCRGKFLWWRKENNKEIDTFYYL